jgi:glucose/arabinose dehydrogenase
MVSCISRWATAAAQATPSETARLDHAARQDLRIDADGSSPAEQYGIPGDNPFAGNSCGFREEIFAYGFRNPWRFSFDRLPAGYGPAMWARTRAKRSTS